MDSNTGAISDFALVKNREVWENWGKGRPCVDSHIWRHFRFLPLLTLDKYINISDLSLESLRSEEFSGMNSIETMSIVNRP